MRKVMVVSLMGLRERKRKLFFNPFWRPARLGCTCRNESTFKATGLRAVLILFPGKAVRHGTPPTVFVVEGSKIWPRNSGLLSHGLSTGIGGPPGIGLGVVNAAPSKAEKSPVRSASVGRVERLEVVGLLRYCSQEKKKNVLSCPLYNLGSHTGPPKLPPKSFWWSLGLGTLSKSFFQEFASILSLRNMSNAVP